MYSANDTLAGGFPHSEICGSKLVCQLPAAYRRLLRPSSPVIAKASTTCTYSLDPISLRTWRHENQVKGQACVKFAASQFHSRTLRFVCSTQSHLLFRQRNNMSTTSKLLKNSRTVRTFEPEVAWRLPEGKRSSDFRINIPSLEHRRVPHAVKMDGGGERDRTDDPLLAKQVLSQLSYTPGNPLHHQLTRPCGLANWWVWLDSNQRPPPYQDGALTS